MKVFIKPELIKKCCCQLFVEFFKRIGRVCLVPNQYLLSIESFFKICLGRVNLLLEVTLESVLNTHALISFIRVNPYENIYFTNKLYEPPKYASANIFHFLADPGWKFYFPAYRVRKKYLRLKYACAIIVLVIFVITVYSFLL